MTIISFSEVMKWQTCQRQYYYRFGLGYAPIDTSEAIATGVFGHKLLEVFYKALQSGDYKWEAFDVAHKYASEALRRAVGSEQTSLLVAWTLVENYIRKTEFKSEVVLVENRFLIPATRLSDDPVFEGVQIGFTPDLAIKRSGKFIDVEDYKFVMKAWGERKIARFPQLKLYKIFLNLMNYDVSRCVLRFFNTTTAKMTIENYDPTPKEEEILTRDFMAGVKEVLMFKLSAGIWQEEAPRTMNYTNCQYCQFERPCTLESKGQDASKLLKYQFQKSTYDYNT